MEWTDNKHASLNLKSPDLKEAYTMHEDMDKMDPMIAQLNKLHSDGNIKGHNLQSSLKDLWVKLKNERIS